MGSSDHVASPTFTISREYSAPDTGLRLYHFDFYRLAEPGIMADELAEILQDAKAVVVVEWGGIVEGVLPEQKIVIEITRTGENSRELTVHCPAVVHYVVE
jgi:tRNA threonylcarbamoyladenosine biosynthesis protein TsaE